MEGNPKGFSSHGVSVDGGGVPLPPFHLKGITRHCKKITAFQKLFIMRSGCRDTDPGCCWLSHAIFKPFVQTTGKVASIIGPLLCYGPRQALGACEVGLRSSGKSVGEKTSDPISAVTHLTPPVSQMNLLNQSLS